MRPEQAPMYNFRYFDGKFIRIRLWDFEYKHLCFVARGCGQSVHFLIGALYNKHGGKNFTSRVRVFILSQLTARAAKCRLRKEREHAQQTHRRGAVV